MEENKSLENDTSHKIKVDKKLKNEQSTDGKSPVWQYFNKVETDNKVYTHCIIGGCEEKLVYHSSTTTMMRHLKALHPDAHDNCLASKQKTPSKQ